jgi:hypothetical protein
MDHQGPEHHYDEVESPENGRVLFFQQGEIQPETVVSEGGKRPFRGQPNPIKSEMTERNTPLDGASNDKGGNPLIEGIFAKSVIEEAEEEADQVTDPTEPAGLGETHPMKDNQWKPGDRSDRANGRDEMLGSVRKSVSEDDEWAEVVEDFKHALPEPAIHRSSVPDEHLGWDIVEVIEPKKEITEAFNKYSVPFPEGITDKLHDALIELNVWVENPEENGKLRPYKEYWSVIKPNIGQGLVQIGVEDPHMADIINDVARTDSLSALDKTSNFNKKAGPLAALGEAALAAFPGIAGAIGMGGEALSGAGALTKGLGLVKDVAKLNSVGNLMGDVMGGGDGKAAPIAQETPQDQSVDEVDKKDENSVSNKSILDQLSTDIPVQNMSLGYLGKTATYGDDYESPSSVSRRIEDPENIDPHQRPDGSNDHWNLDMKDVNEIGSTNDPRGKDDAKERIRRQFAAAEDKNKEDLGLLESPAIQKFFETLPLILNFFDSEESGFDDPIVKSVHEGLEAEFPGYLDLPMDAEENEIVLLFAPEKAKNKKDKKKSSALGPANMMPRKNQPLMPDPTMGPKQPVPNSIDPSTHGYDPQTGPASAASNTPGWENQSSPNIVDTSNPLTPEQQQQAQQLTQNKQQEQQQADQQIQQEMQNQKQGSHTQGPHTDEQQAAVAELLLAEGREKEIPDMIENPDKYDQEMAQIQKKDPTFGEEPEDMKQPPPAAAPPAPNQGMPPGMPPMGTPQPVNAPMGPVSASVSTSMLKAAFKHGADSVSGRCPKCDSHTTKMVSQDGTSKCHTCAHEWKDDTFRASDGDSSDLSSTAAYHKALRDIEEGKKPKHLDSFNDPEEEELEVDDHTHQWMDDEGNPLEEGKEYEIYANNYDIPDVARLDEIKPDSLVYTIESNGGLHTTIEIDRKEADLNGYRFVATDSETSENHAGIGENLDTKNVTAPGQDSDLSTPHIQIGSSFENHDEALVEIATEWLLSLDGPYLFTEFESMSQEDYEQEVLTLPYDTILEIVNNHYDGGIAGLAADAGLSDDEDQGMSAFGKTAGKHYTPMEQRELIDEYGEARNASKLKLEGTHYADAEDDDYFLFGC